MNKVALIIGAGKGLGRSISEKFAQEKYDLILTYFESELETKNLSTYIKKEYSVDVKIFKLDITDEKNVDIVFSKIDRIDVLINNAAYNNDNIWNEKETFEFKKILNTNILGPFLTIKYAFPLLKATKGNIINIASTNGIDTMYSESLDYDASKAALINMTKNLASELAPDIRVNAIAPGWINTHKTSDLNPKFKENEIKKIAMKRFGEPTEIAEVVYFIASTKASYINGSIIRVDGGIKYGL